MARLPRLLVYLKAMWAEVPHTHLFTVSAAMAYYGLFGLLPALAAAAALIGQLGGFHALQNAVDSDGQLLPAGSLDILRQFVVGVPRRFGGGLGLAVNLGIVVFTAWRAATGLLTALNIVYDVEERRSGLGRAWVALLIGVSGILFLVSALALVTLPPALAGSLPVLIGWISWLRWPALAVTFALGLGLLFRFAPARPAAPWRWVACGAVVGTALWILTTLGVSLYVAHIASFGRLYGSLGGVAVVLVWFYGGAFAVLLGAETDAVLFARATGREPSRLHQDLRRRARAH